MAANEPDTDTAAARIRYRELLAARIRAVLDALEHLVSGLGTAMLAFACLIWLLLVGLACLAGVGLLLAPTMPRAVRIVADRERSRLGRWGSQIPQPDRVPPGVRTAFADPVVRRELQWLLVHSTLGLFLGTITATMTLNAVQNITYPLWWRLLPPDHTAPTTVLWTVRTEWDALAVALLGLGMAAAFPVVGPGMARLQAWPGRRLLVPPGNVDLSLRVAELSATRAAALDAHALELRRIERSLHDGAQNRLVTVTVLLGATRRALSRDPPSALDTLERAQDAAELALAELRAVVRGILPPVLADRGLADALAGLAASCAVSCQVNVDMPDQCAASVEATAYFVTAEALTNVSKHSRARNASVAVRVRDGRLLLRIQDDGVGGADEYAGSGITGIRGRIEAHDGHLTVASPPGGPTTLDAELPCGS